MILKDHSVQYAYALDVQGTLIHVGEALRSGRYTCPGCKGSLVAVLAEKYAQHFRHYESRCSLETYLHKCAKEAFYSRYKQALDSKTAVQLLLKRTVVCNSDRSRLLLKQDFPCKKRMSASYDLTRFFNQVELEKHDHATGLKPDIMLSSSSSHKRCYVEICVTHPCSPEKIDSGVPILEFKIESEADIQMLLRDSYKVSDERMNAYNFHPKSQIMESCNGTCPISDVEMSVWRMSQSGRLNEHTMPLKEVDLKSNSYVNAWPKSLTGSDLRDRLRKFLSCLNSHSHLANCLMCHHSSQWKNGYLHCHRKDTWVPYMEARQCADYEASA